MGKSKLYQLGCLIIIICCRSIILSGQSKSDLIQTLEQLKSNITEVPGKSKTYAQEFSWDDENPYLIQLNSEEIGKNGKSVNSTFSLSLLDADKNTFRTKTEKDIITIPLYMKRKKKFIKHYKNGSQESYLDKISIVAQNIENARAIEELLTKASEQSEKIAELILPKDFNSRLNWLTENTTKVIVNEMEYTQSLEGDDEVKTRVTYSLVDPKGEGEKDLWEFNLADVNPKSIELSTKGNQVFVEVAMKKNNYVANTTDKGLKYTNDFSFLVSEILTGKMMEQVIQQIIPDAETMEKDRFENSGMNNSALEHLSKIIQSVTQNNSTLSQSLTANCITEYTQTENSEKGDSKKRIYQFNLADLNPKNVTLKVSGDEIVLNLQTKSLKLVQSFEDGEIQNYSNKVSLIASDLENAKWLKYLLPTAIETCQTEFEKSFSSQVDVDVNTLSKSITGIDELGQSLKILDEGSCQWQFTQTKENKNGAEDEVYEFGLNDLNEKEVGFVISGKSLGIELKTKKNEKIIKYYKNGEPGDYQNKMIIQMDNIETARKLLRGIKRKINSCQEQ